MNKLALILTIFGLNANALECIDYSGNYQDNYYKISITQDNCDKIEIKYFRNESEIPAYDITYHKEGSYQERLTENFFGMYIDAIYADHLQSTNLEHYNIRSAENRFNLTSIQQLEKMENGDIKETNSLYDTRTGTLQEATGVWKKL